MNMFDNLLAQTSGLDLSALGARFGMTPEQVETAARALLPQIADPAVDNGEAVATVAASTGTPQPSLQALVPALLQQAQSAGATGGAFQSILGGLQGGTTQGGGLGGLIGALDRDGDGNPLDDVLGMFGRGSTR
jgi:hypothetical protein